MSLLEILESVNQLNYKIFLYLFLKKTKIILIAYSYSLNLYILKKCMTKKWKRKYKGCDKEMAWYVPRDLFISTM